MLVGSVLLTTSISGGISLWTEAPQSIHFETSWLTVFSTTNPTITGTIYLSNRPKADNVSDCWLESLIGSQQVRAKAPKTNWGDITTTRFVRAGKANVTFRRTDIRGNNYDQLSRWALEMRNFLIIKCGLAHLKKERNKTRGDRHFPLDNTFIPDG